MPLEIVEVTEGTGRACGSMFLDERFEDLLRGRMGANKYDSLSNVSKDAVRTYWQERVKPYYTGGQRKKKKVSDQPREATVGPFVPDVNLCDLPVSRYPLRRDYWGST